MTSSQWRVPPEPPVHVLASLHLVPTDPLASGDHICAAETYPLPSHEVVNRVIQRTDTTLRRDIKHYELATIYKKSQLSL